LYEVLIFVALVVYVWVHSERKDFEATIFSGTRPKFFGCVYQTLGCEGQIAWLWPPVECGCGDDMLGFGVVATTTKFGSA